jgi:ABC-type branched-subunit amino acid transport system substrate-binding protein
VPPRPLYHNSAKLPGAGGAAPGYPHDMRGAVTRSLVAGLLLAGVGLGLVAGTAPVDAQGLGRRSTGPTFSPPATTRPGTDSSRPSRRAGPVIREVPLVVGALLPMVGAASWYGDEIRRGLDLAVARVNPPPPRPAPTTSTGSGSGGSGTSGSGSAGSTTGAGSSGSGAGSVGAGSPRSTIPGGRPGGESAADSAASRGGESDAEAPVEEMVGEPEEPVAGDDASADGGERSPTASAPSGDREGGPGASSGGPGGGAAPGRGTAGPTPPQPPRLRITLKVENADPRDPKALNQAWERLLAAGASVVITASPTPTMVIYPQAAARDVLVVNQGYRHEKVPAQTRVLLHARPSPADLGRAAAGYARDRGVRRLGLLAAGSEFGKQARAALVEAWRAAGRAPVFDESLNVDSPDVPSRLRRLAAAGAEGVVLAYRGEELGDLTARIRAAGVAAPLLVLDDDPLVALSGGPEVADVLVLSDAYADPDDGQLFPETYRGKYSREPSRFAAHAYETMALVARAAQTLMRESKTFGGGRLRDTLKTVALPSQAFGIPMSFREDGTLGRPLSLSSVERSRVHFIRFLDPPDLGATAAR